MEINTEVCMERIRQLRAERGLSQAKLAVMADMDPATLNRLEQGKGNPNLRTLERVADALGVGVADLLGKASALPAPQKSLFNDLAREEQRAAVTELLSNRLEHAHLMRSLAETEQQAREMTLEELKVRGAELLDEKELALKAFLDSRRYFPLEMTANRQRLEALWAELQAVLHGFWPHAAVLHRIWSEKLRLQHDMSREALEEGLKEMESFLATAAEQEAKVPS
jgi:transcriptional regulator with XRE-family HTH domain